MSLEEQIRQQISTSKVLVYSKSYCPYCTSTKNSLQSLRVPAEVYELDQISNGDAIQAALLKITGQRTVPNIFIGGVHVGGNSDLQTKISSGEAQSLLARAGIQV
mmetsp:Transcript_34225/g.59893  ORF Transcript_34225/g.59893 Transcript_34225/m.59893 type:complete len:105 (-) Transcript_34225:1261-1575(-)